MLKCAKVCLSVLKYKKELKGMKKHEKVFGSVFGTRVIEFVCVYVLL